MTLRGYDDYEVTLGDEMRGNRASLNKSLEDAERDLRIRAKFLAAIENSDLTGFPNRSVVAGYVRSYARYLRMDPEDVYRRFCALTGFVSPTSAFGTAQASAMSAAERRASLASGPGAELAQSRFAMPPEPRRIGARVSLGAIVSVAALGVLATGLAYGGYSLLQDLQRVGFEPLPEAPAVVAEIPDIQEPVRADISDYSDSGALSLAEAAAPAELASVTRRVGPISAIDPDRSGIYVSSAAPEPVERRDADPGLSGVLSANEAIRLAEAEEARRDALARAAAIAAAGGADLDAPAILPALARAGEVEAQPAANAARGVAVHAVEAAWVRIFDVAGDVIFEGTLGAGERFDIPERVEGPRLRAGNPTAVYVTVDGAAHGPVGPANDIVRRLSLEAMDLVSLPRRPQGVPRSRAEASRAARLQE